MPKPIVEQIADAVAAQLNAADLSQDFTAAVEYFPELPELKKDEEDELRVIVRPASREREREDRSQDRKEFAIDVGVVKRPGATTNDALRPYVLLFEEIDDALFATPRPPALPAAVLMSAAQGELFDADDLFEKGRFLSVTTYTYRYWS